LIHPSLRFAFLLVVACFATSLRYVQPMSLMVLTDLDKGQIARHSKAPFCAIAIAYKPNRVIYHLPIDPMIII